MKRSMSRQPWLILTLLAVSLPVFAQQDSGAAAPQKPDVTSTQAQDQPAPQPLPPVPTHRFWDKTNILLFSGVVGARYFDYGSTLWMRNRGVNEWLLTNEIVDNHAEFAAIEFAGAAASVALSYAFHATGHHKLERAVSIIHIGVATGGAIRNFTLP